MKKLKKKYKVVYVGVLGRKPRTDKSPISEYRDYLKCCMERGISRDIMCQALKDIDPRFADYDTNKLNLYCSRMFRRIPILKRDEYDFLPQPQQQITNHDNSDEDKGKLPYNHFFLFLLLLLPFKAFSYNWEFPYNNTQSQIQKPNFMKDDFYTNTNEVFLSDYFSYRTPMLNSSYNIEKGKILSTLIGKQNSLNLANKGFFYTKAKQSIFLLEKISKQTENYNRLNFLLLQKINN